MKIKTKYISAVSIVLITIGTLFTACQEEVVGPDTVPIKAEIKQVIVENSISRVDVYDSNPADKDTVVLTIPQGTDITNLDLDILVSYFSTISPEPGITDLTNPVTYTVTSNVEEREVMVIANIVAPSLTSFMMTTPREVIAQIKNDSIIMSLQEGIDYTAITFVAEYFGESINPTTDETIDLTTDPILSVLNKDFSSDYQFAIDWYKIVEFTGTIFDGTQHPSEFLPGCLAPENEDGWVIEEDGGAYAESVAHFTSLEDDNGQAEFLYGGMGLNPNPDETTTVFKVQGIADAEENYLEIAFKLDNLRAKFYIRNDRLEIAGNEKVTHKYPIEALPDYDPTQWNIYRITCNKVTREIKLYINEDFEPFMIGELADHSGGPYVKVGDGGGKLYECLIDYIAFEAEGAYSPEDLPLSKIIIK